MITKQQALEFIYELSQKHEVTINGKTGFIGINSHFDIDEETFYYEYEECAYENSLEAAITAFVRHYINYDILKDFDIIPVDTSMLEVGQAYKVSLDGIYDGCRTTFNAKLIEVLEEKYKFLCEDGSYYKDIVLEKNSFYEIYKVVE